MDEPENTEPRSSDDLDCLHTLLRHLPQGEVPHDSEVASLLASCWDDIPGGDDGGMTSDKALARLKDLRWEPPLLHLKIDRHGAMKYGSSREEVQHWTLDVDEMRLCLGHIGRRQKNAPQPRLDVDPLAEEAVTLIINRREDPRLKWMKDGTVRVLVGQVLPEDSAVQETLAGRRKRFWKRLTELLAKEGWHKVEGTRDRFGQIQSRKRGSRH